MSNEQKPIKPEVGKWEPVNLNVTVRVKLNNDGRRIYKEYLERLAPYRQHDPPKEDSEGWSTWQLWELMHYFGAHMTMGMNPPVNPCIEIRRTTIAEAPAPRTWWEWVGSLINKSTNKEIT